MPYAPHSDRYDQIKYRRCGNSGILLPEISLGFWHNFGENAQHATIKEIIFTAFDKGITHFDLANNYGPPPGAAEKSFGKVLKEDLGAYRDELLISSKAGYLMWPGPYGEWGSRKYLIASCDQSLNRMGLDYVDIFYTHRFDPNTPLEETMQALDYIVRSGRALYIGISRYTPEQTREALAILKELGTPCLIHQEKYSMLHREPENGILDLLKENKIGSIVFSPLAQGLLSDKYIHAIPDNSRAAETFADSLDTNAITPELKNQLQALNKIALNREQTLAQMALAWILQRDEITSVLVGARTKEQLLDNIKATHNTTFTEEENKAIETLLA